MLDAAADDRRVVGAGHGLDIGVEGFERLARVGRRFVGEAEAAIAGDVAGVDVERLARERHGAGVDVGGATAGVGGAGAGVVATAGGGGAVVARLGRDANDTTSTMRTTSTAAPPPMAMRRREICGMTKRGPRARAGSGSASPDIG